MFARFFLFIPLVMASSHAFAVEQAPVTACNNPPAASSLNVVLRPQKTRLWCWAASGQMVMDYLGKSVQQCTQANRRLGRSDCCKSPTPKQCIQGGWPEFQRYGFNYKKTNSTPLSWEALEEQLAPTDGSKACGFTPFAFSWHWTGGGGHMMVAIGYQVTADGKKYLIVNDPWPPNEGRRVQAMLYDAYDAVVGDHSHWDDYYDVRPK